MQCHDVMESDDHLSLPRWYWLCGTYYLFVSLLFIKLYQFEIDADGVSYISIAQKYLYGDFAHVANGHWAPLISCLLVPFLYLGMEPILAFRIVSIPIGLCVLLGINRFMEELKVGDFTRILYLLALVPVVAWYAENDVGADFLCACIVLYYVLVTTRSGYPSGKWSGGVAGVLGGVSYLAKSYNFYFFLLHFTGMNIWYFFDSADSTERRRELVRFFLSGLALFAIVSGIWIGVISQKYHAFTVSTAGSYNMSFIRPGSPGHPMETDGIFPPPNVTALSAWEDPSCIKQEHWNPLHSGSEFTFYLHSVWKNVTKYVAGFATNIIFDLTLLCLAGMLLFSRAQLDRRITYILFTILIYPLGYFALYYDGQRYVEINALLLYVLSAFLCDCYLTGANGSKRVRYAASAGLVLSLMLLTAHRVYKDYRYDLSFLNDAHNLSQHIAKFYDLRKMEIVTEGGNWNYGLDLSYFLQARYFGKIRAGESDQELHKELVSNRINYFLAFGALRHRLGVLKKERVFPSALGEMTLYQVVLPEESTPRAP